MRSAYDGMCMGDVMGRDWDEDEVKREWGGKGRSVAGRLVCMGENK